LLRRIGSIGEIHLAIARR